MGVSGGDDLNRVSGRGLLIQGHLELSLPGRRDVATPDHVTCRVACVSMPSRVPRPGDVAVKAHSPRGERTNTSVLGKSWPARGTTTRAPEFLGSGHGGSAMLVASFAQFVLMERTSVCRPTMLVPRKGGFKRSMRRCEIITGRPVEWGGYVAARCRAVC
jgi:hypothetical protein